jgi:hypothetical protein
MLLLHLHLLHLVLLNHILLLHLRLPHNLQHFLKYYLKHLLLLFHHQLLELVLMEMVLDLQQKLLRLHRLHKDQDIHEVQNLLLHPQNLAKVILVVYFLLHLLMRNYFHLHLNHLLFLID